MFDNVLDERLCDALLNPSQLLFLLRDVFGVVGVCQSAADDAAHRLLLRPGVEILLVERGHHGGLRLDLK
jgi:hypothetical protein